MFSNINLCCDIESDVVEIEKYELLFPALNGISLV